MFFVCKLHFLRAWGLFLSKKMTIFWSFIFLETYICYRGYFNLNYYIGKKVQKNFLMGLKIWWSWGSGYSKIKIPIGRTVLCFLCVNFIFCGLGGSFWVKKWQFFGFFRKCRMAAQPPTCERAKRALGSEAVWGKPEGTSLFLFQ